MWKFQPQWFSGWQGYTSISLFAYLKSRNILTFPRPIHFANLIHDSSIPHNIQCMNKEIKKFCPEYISTFTGMVRCVSVASFSEANELYLLTEADVNMKLNICQIQNQLIFKAAVQNKLFYQR